MPNHNSLVCKCDAVFLYFSNEEYLCCCQLNYQVATHFSKGKGEKMGLIV